LFSTTTAAYTFPTPFHNVSSMGIVVTYGTGGTIVVPPTVVTSLSATAITITGASVSGIIEIHGQ